MRTFRRTSFLVLSSVASGALAIASAQAQTASQAPAPTPVAASAKAQRFSIPAGPLAAALNAWSQQTGRSIVFRSDDVAGRRSPGVKGRMTADAALRALLANTGFFPVTTEGGAIGLLPVDLSPEGRVGGATPDILVTGRKSFSLNTGIKRSQDDSQPFIVMTGKEIEQSGAPNLATFLRDRLNVNSDPTVAEQTAPGSQLPTGRGLSSINLRGIGVRDTLILVDGRRQPGVNLGDGNLTQASITGIPIASIDRIEVLAASASGIYGSGASGGVINIITKRDFSGGQITARYGNTTDFKKGDAQVDVTYGLPLEGGRTRLSFTGSWQRGLPLLTADRYALAKTYRDQILVNDPTFFDSSTATPNSTAVNYRTSNGGPLQLKPQYGGATLNSSLGTIPTGYRGIAADGIAGLLSGVGKFTLDPADTAVAPGLRAPLLYGSELFSGSMTMRREFNPWLTGHISFQGSRTTSTTPYAVGPTLVSVSSLAANNPFTQRITVALPAIGREVMVGNVQQQRSVVAGAIVKLPYEWQAALDMSFSASEFSSDKTPSYLSQATATQLSNGTQNVLRDLSAYPVSLAYQNSPFGNARTPAKASTFAPSLRLAGPLPITLGGGKPQMTVNIEYDIDRVAATKGVNLSDSSRGVTYQPTSMQRTRSIYGEIAFPLIGERNHIPLVQQLELRVSARAEGYSADGTNTINCFLPYTPGVTTDPYAGCPGPTDVVKRAKTRNSHVDPSISFRWFPVSPIMLRGSYTTGYLPPKLSQLITIPGQGFVIVGDPQRGGEPIGTTPGPFGFTLPVSTGGNPNVRPESSKTMSFGVVVKPGGVLDGVRLSADWTRIKKRDIYYDPLLLVFSNTPQARALFNTFITALPDRAPRGAPSGGFAVGPITSLDLSLANLNGLSTEAIDFVAELRKPLFGGTLDVNARATTVLSLKVDTFPGQPQQNLLGVAPNPGFATLASAGALRWRGNGWANWSKGPLTLGYAVRYLDSYAVLARVAKGQGGPTVASQVYHDLNITYRFPRGITLNASMSNVFNTKPPLDASADPLFYSSYADPRLRNFFVSVTKSF